MHHSEVFLMTFRGENQILELLLLKGLDLAEESQHAYGGRKAMFYKRTKGGRDPNPNILLLDKQVFIAVWF